MNAGTPIAYLFAALIGSACVASGQATSGILPANPGEGNNLVRVKPADIGPKRYRYTRAVAQRNGTQESTREPKASGTLEIIFDSSNSMNGRIAGVRKIDLAKEALRHLANALERTDFQVGIIV